MKKIIIFGYSHCGTTILKSIISHIDDVYTFLNEKLEINENDIYNIKDLDNYKYFLCKYAQFKKIFIGNEYKDYIKLFIIRDPKYVFSSINIRCGTTCKCHSINDYILICKYFNNFLSNPLNNLYLIKYENMFNDNFKNLKEIFNKIGFIYNENIFNNTNYKNYANEKLLSIPINKPDEQNHLEYRTWQINQQFINNNDNNKINLTKQQIKIIKHNKYINSIYPDSLNT